MTPGRVVFLDAQPVLSTSFAEEMLKADKRYNLHYKTLENFTTIEVSLGKSRPANLSSTFQSLEIAAWLLAVSHVVLLVTDSFPSKKEGTWDGTRMGQRLETWSCCGWRGRRGCSRRSPRTPPPPLPTSAAPTSSSPIKNSRFDLSRPLKDLVLFSNGSLRWRSAVSIKSGSAAGFSTTFSPIPSWTSTVSVCSLGGGLYRCLHLGGVSASRSSQPEWAEAEGLAAVRSVSYFPLPELRLRSSSRAGPGTPPPPPLLLVQKYESSETGSVPALDYERLVTELRVLVRGLPRAPFLPPASGPLSEKNWWETPKILERAWATLFQAFLCPQDVGGNTQVPLDCRVWPAAALRPGAVDVQCQSYYFVHQWLAIYL